MFATENEAVLKLVTDEHVGNFVELIRSVGRQSRFTKFMAVLCRCDGLAIRHNQWRICGLLVRDAPELLLNLRLEVAGASAAAPVTQAEPSDFKREENSSAGKNEPSLFGR